MTADSSDGRPPDAEAGDHAPVPGDRWLRRRWWIPVVVALAPILLMLVAMTWFIGKDDNASVAETTGATGTTAAGADFTEVPTFDLTKVGGAKFASLTMQRGEALQSYMFASGQAGFAALAEVVAAAKPAEGALDATGATLTFVTKDKGTVTLTLDLAANRFGYGGKTWQPNGDLKAIVDEAVARK
jgi:hypothetical protein